MVPPTPETLPFILTTFRSTFEPPPRYHPRKGPAAFPVPPLGPSTPIPTSFSFTFPAYLTCPSFSTLRFAIGMPC